MTPPIANDRKLTLIPKIPEEVPFKILLEMIIKIIQVASFIKDSPSIREENFLGAPTSLSKAITAAVSVQDMMLPNKNAVI